LAIEGAKVLVLGAGGAARAAVFALKERAAEVWILNRTSVKGQKLARQAKARTIPSAGLSKVAFDVIVNATPVGMGNTRDCPLKDEEIQARVVFDMVYDPVETHLLQVARTKGIAVIPGIEMFVQQAARQFEIWTGKPAPAGEMLRAVAAALQERPTAEKQPRS
ncbi:MAG: shikimate dehydrogenase, partial [Terriglobales bacterium]